MSDAPEPPKPQFNRGEKRSAARLAAVQALYQMDITAKGLNEIFAEFESHWMGREIDGDQYKPAEGKLFRDLVQGVVDRQLELDPRVDGILAATWPLKRVEAVMRAILRAGAMELIHMRSTPPKVAISEYVNIAQAFFERDETNMINAVLDKLAHEERAEELAAALNG
jgi:transcription antitermination protein NusB